MEANGQPGNNSPEERVLHWPGRVLTWEDLQRSLDGHQQVVVEPRAIITPSAAEELRANGVQVIRQTVERMPAPKRSWAYALERPHPVVASVIRSLERDGFVLRELPTAEGTPVCEWARAVAECVARGECSGGIAFCLDPGVICCVANKVPGLRAVAVANPLQAARVNLTLAPNLIAVEVPGRTFFEVRQLIRTFCGSDGPLCPPGMACMLQELDGHAHR
jgi:ribose 5-phosphate isomerase RpiB